MAADLMFLSMVAEAKREELMRQAARAHRLPAWDVAERPHRVRPVVRGLFGLATAGLLSLALVTGVDAQATAAGNGGTAFAAANGGGILIGDIDAGDNAGNAIGVGDVDDGAVGIDGGETGTETAVGVGAAGGIGLTDASGGDENLAIVAN